MLQSPRQACASQECATGRRQEHAKPIAGGSRGNSRQSGTGASAGRLRGGSGCSAKAWRDSSSTGETPVRVGSAAMSAPFFLALQSPTNRLKPQNCRNSSKNSAKSAIADCVLHNLSPHLPPIYRPAEPERRQAERYGLGLVTSEGYSPPHEPQQTKGRKVWHSRWSPCSRNRDAWSNRLWQC